MKNVLSAGVVVYRMNNDEPEFLLIFNAKGHWDFGKGKIEEGEDKKTAALRELQEEAGITAILKNDFEYSYSYDFIDYDGKKAHKTISFFMGLA
ncbi:NUDIX domain-containing protein, partial [bacterium]|nr:NUDIX domain-containing protein [bacterium]